MANNEIIKSIKIRELFGRLNYDIDFSNNEDISILIAPNGTGKSTIFHFVQYMLEPSYQRYENLHNTSFKSFLIELSNGYDVLLESNNNEHEEMEHYPEYFCSLSFSIKARDGKQVNTDRERMKEYAEFLDENNTLKAKNIYLSLRSKHDEIKDWKESEEIKKEAINTFYKLMGIMLESSGNLHHVRHIEANREDSIVFNKYKENLFKVLQGDLDERVNEYLNILNEKHKEEEIKFIIAHNLRNEIVMKVCNTYDENNVFSIDKLSSAQKNDLVLYFYLIFRLNNEDLFLIDEPELSQHIDEQEKIIGNIIDIKKTKGFQAIVATHSPYVVSIYFNLLAYKEVFKSE